MKFQKAILSSILLATLFMGPMSFAAESKTGGGSEKPEMRHSWSVVTGAKRNLEGVNDSESLMKGKVLYQNHCSLCHGKNGEGDGEMAKSFNLHPANLKVLAAKKANHQLVIQINEGKAGMPKWKDLLTEQQVWDLTNFIQNMAIQK